MGSKARPLNSGGTEARETGRLRRVAVRRGGGWRGPGREIGLEGGEFFGGDFGFGVEAVRNCGSGMAPSWIMADGFIERGFLRGGGLGAEGGEVEMLAGGEDVMPDEPVGGDDFVEPGEAALVRVAAVAIFFEDVMDFGRGLDFCGGGLGGNGWAQELERDKGGDSEKGEFGRGAHGEN